MKNDISHPTILIEQDKIINEVNVVLEEDEIITKELIEAHKNFKKFGQRERIPKIIFYVSHNYQLLVPELRQFNPIFLETYTNYNESKYIQNMDQTKIFRTNNILTPSIIKAVSMYSDCLCLHFDTFKTNMEVLKESRSRFRWIAVFSQHKKDAKHEVFIRFQEKKKKGLLSCVVL